MSDTPVLHRGIGTAKKCRSCGQRIVFARTTVGRVGPFEEDPHGLWILENGAAKYVGAGRIEVPPGESAPTRYTSHFARCADAQKWRRTDD